MKRTATALAVAGLTLTGAMTLTAGASSEPLSHASTQTVSAQALGLPALNGPGMFAAARTCPKGLIPVVLDELGGLLGNLLGAPPTECVKPESNSGSDEATPVAPEPEPTEEPAPAPSPKPTSKPKPTPTQSPKPTPKPTPTQSPSPSPTQSPKPAPTEDAPRPDSGSGGTDAPSGTSPDGADSETGGTTPGTGGTTPGTGDFDDRTGDDSDAGDAGSSTPGGGFTTTPGAGSRTPITGGETAGGDAAFGDAPAQASETGDGVSLAGSGDGTLAAGEPQTQGPREQGSGTWRFAENLIAQAGEAGGTGRTTGATSGDLSDYAKLMVPLDENGNPLDGQAAGAGAQPREHSWLLPAGIMAVIVLSGISVGSFLLRPKPKKA